MVPTMFHRLLSLPPTKCRRSYDVSSLVFIIHGAAPCPVDVKRRAHRVARARSSPSTTPRPKARARRCSRARVAEEAGHGRQGRTRPTTSASSTTTAPRSPPGTIGTVYLKAPASQPLRVLQGAGEDRRCLPRRLLHARRRRLRRRGRLPLPHRPQRAPHHHRRREHLSGRGRRGAARASRGRRRRCRRRPRRRVGRDRRGGGRAPRGHRAVAGAGRRDRRVVPRPHRALQVSPPRRVRRGTAPARQREALQAPAARAAPTMRRIN